MSTAVPRATGTHHQGSAPPKRWKTTALQHHFSNGHRNQGALGERPPFHKLLCHFAVYRVDHFSLCGCPSIYVPTFEGFLCPLSLYGSLVSSLITQICTSDKTKFNNYKREQSQQNEFNFERKTIFSIT